MALMMVGNHRRGRFPNNFNKNPVKKSPEQEEDNESTIEVESTTPQFKNISDLFKNINKILIL